MSFVKQHVAGDKLVIISKGRGTKYEQDFFYAIEDAFEEGYRFPRGKLDLQTRSMRNAGMVGKAIMFSGEDPTLEEEIDEVVDVVSEDNVEYISEIYKQFLDDPTSVSDEWRDVFEAKAITDEVDPPEEKSDEETNTETEETDEKENSTEDDESGSEEKGSETDDSVASKTVTPEDLVVLDTLPKRKMVIEWAEGFGIEVPDNLKNPAAVKKWIKESLEPKEEV